MKQRRADNKKDFKIRATKLSRDGRNEAGISKHAGRSLKNWSADCSRIFDINFVG